ncbi:DUF4145 domain-containing protein [uncultured Porphyromonas sp.]|uniref:DUF4145 domain-containing protein n=1 Tax=uncultured Porphyromonas sp. TaxID=159274 RepID=UPI002591C1EA|nr:DUF4145 domain-containing protein [uncultured Porphyromonas sp.]
MSKDYIAPRIDLKAYTCPHCNTLAQVEVEKFNMQGDVFVSPAGTLSCKSYVIVHRCQCCGNKILWIDNEYIYPDIIAEEANPDMPESVRRLYEEAGLIYNKSPRAACALLRLAVENLCQELGQVDRDINKNIAALVQKGLPPSIQKALDTVRVVGNKAVHPGQIAIDVDDVNTAKMLMRLLNMIVERMITEPKELEEVYGLLPKSTREAIERRDQ